MAIAFLDTSTTTNPVVDLTHRLMSAMIMSASAPTEQAYDLSASTFEAGRRRDQATIDHWLHTMSECSNR